MFNLDFNPESPKITTELNFHWQYRDELLQLVNDEKISEDEKSKFIEFLDQKNLESQLSINLHSAPIVADNGKHHDLPPGRRMQVYEEPDTGNPVLAMTPGQEALWLSFTNGYSNISGIKFAVKIFVGGDQNGNDRINVITGEIEKSLDEQLSLIADPSIDSTDKQNYIVAPEQLWLDGFKLNKNTVSQFVVQPLGENKTIAEAMTGSTTSGLTIVAFSPKVSEIYKLLKKEQILQEQMLQRQQIFTEDGDGLYYFGDMVDWIGAIEHTDDPYRDVDVTRGVSNVDVTRGISDDVLLGFGAGGIINQKIRKDYTQNPEDFFDLSKGEMYWVKVKSRDYMNQQGFTNHQPKFDNSQSFWYQFASEFINFNKKEEFSSEKETVFAKIKEEMPSTHFEGQISEDAPLVLMDSLGHGKQLIFSAAAETASSSVKEEDIGGGYTKPNFS